MEAGVMLHHPSPRIRGLRAWQAGYSLIELVITVGMIVIVTTWAMPSFLSYYQSARVRAGAQAVSAYLNEGRQLAIKTNGSVCVSYTTSTMQFRTTNCSGALISVAGLVNSSNSIRLPDGISLSSTASAIFGQLGNATTGATYTVTDTASNRTLTVTVAGSGRITIP
jgi:Tfp pilus assembly protein FimT